jgi:hypothetical protein
VQRVAVLQWAVTGNMGIAGVARRLGHPRLDIWLCVRLDTLDAHRA